AAHPPRKGTRSPGLRLPICHAARHERPRAPLHGTLPPAGRPVPGPAPGPGHEPARPERRRPVPATFRRLPRQPGLLLPAAAEELVTRRKLAAGCPGLVLVLLAVLAVRAANRELDANNEALFPELHEVHALSAEQMS